MQDQNDKNYKETLKIPLVVGVTGHIDILTPEDEIKKQMECFWERIQKAAGPETPVFLLSSIAPGADHLAVKYRPKGMKYCVVLPFDLDEYRKDFETETALAEFEADLKGAYKVIDCHANPKDYTSASDYVRKHSDVLLSLWDGYENLNAETRKAERGGTYYQIREAFGLDDLLIRHPEKQHLIVNLPVVRSRKGPDYHKANHEKKFSGFYREGLSVIEPGKGKPEVADGLVFTPFADYDFKKRPDDSGSPSFTEVLDFIRAHNENLPAKPLEPVNYLREGMMKDHPDAMKIVSDNFSRYEYFDHCALSHQTSHKKQFFRIAVFSTVVGILAQAWGGLLFSSDETIHEWIMHGVILLYLVGWSGVFYYGRKIARENHYEKYLNPRIIAEMLRLKIFWTLAGITESFKDYFYDGSASYPFMVAICNWEITEEPLSERDRKWLDDGNGFAAVKKYWLENQDEYYNTFILTPDPKHFFFSQKEENCTKKPFLSLDCFKRYFKKYERLDGYSNFFKNFFNLCGVVLAGILILIFVLARIFSFDQIKIFSLAWYREFMVGICPFIVATLGWLREKNNWDSLAEQYRDTEKKFKKTQEFIAKEHPLAEKRKIIKELMRFAHQENAEWSEIRKNSRPEPMS